ncbi:MAG: hypothetical protein Q9187_000817 [Circinaria calcarea]
MPPPRLVWRPVYTFALIVLLLAFNVVAKAGSQTPEVAHLNALEIEDALQDLNRHKLATSPQTSGLTSRIFAVLFPGSPAVNALLATLYISGPPSKKLLVDQRK